MHPSDPLAGQLVAALRTELAEAADKMHHCVSQLSEADLWWRPSEGMNAIGNLILHLCGNMRQWIVSSVGGEAFNRDRPSEFAARGGMGRDELMARFDQTLTEVARTLDRVDVPNLLRMREIQKRSESGASALVHSVSHLVGHVQETIYITRLRLGDRYQFRGMTATMQDTSGTRERQGR